MSKFQRSNISLQPWWFEHEIMCLSSPSLIKDLYNNKKIKIKTCLTTFWKEVSQLTLSLLMRIYKKNVNNMEQNRTLGWDSELLFFFNEKWHILPHSPLFVLNAQLNTASTNLQLKQTGLFYLDHGTLKWGSMYLCVVVFVSFLPWPMPRPLSVLQQKE